LRKSTQSRVIPGKNGNKKEIKFVKLWHDGGIEMDIILLLLYNQCRRRHSHCRNAKCSDQRVCLSVCLSVHPLVYLRNHVTNFTKIFCTCYLWSWLACSSSNENAISQVAYFQTSCSHVIRPIGAESKMTLCFIKFARWQHQYNVRHYVC